MFLLVWNIYWINSALNQRGTLSDQLFLFTLNSSKLLIFLGLGEVTKKKRKVQVKLINRDSEKAFKKICVKLLEFEIV